MPIADMKPTRVGSEVEMETKETGNEESGGPSDGDIYLEFAEDQVRRGFVIKVYGILGAQLFLTGLVALVINTAAEAYFKTHTWLLQMSLWSTLLCLVVLVCSPKIARTVPWNYIFLFLFTAFKGVLVGAITSQYSTQSVLVAAFMTMGTVLSLTIFAMTTKTDFTGMAQYLFAGLISLVIWGCISMLFPFNQAMEALYAGAGSLIFSVYIVYNTQMVLGGKHRRHKFCIDDYVFAAINIYLDILNLFIFMLQLLGNRN